MGPRRGSHLLGVSLVVVALAVLDVFLNSQSMLSVLPQLNLRWKRLLPPRDSTEQRVLRGLDLSDAHPVAVSDFLSLTLFLTYILSVRCIGEEA